MVSAASLLLLFERTAATGLSNRTSDRFFLGILGKFEGWLVKIGEMILPKSVENREISPKHWKLETFEEI